MCIIIFLFLKWIKKKIAVWDLRKFSHYIGITEEQANIKKIQFSPSKSDRFAVLTENSAKLNVYRFEESHNSLYKETIQCKTIFRLYFYDFKIYKNFYNIF